MSKLGSLYIALGEPEGPLDGCTCEVGDWAADEITELRNLLIEWHKFSTHVSPSDFAAARWQDSLDYKTKSLLVKDAT